MKKLRNLWQQHTALFSTLLSIILGLIFGLLVMLFTNPSQAFEGMWLILQGGFSRQLNGIGNVLYQGTSLIMTGLAVAFAFKTGLFNIGATGQFTVGAFTAVLIGVKGTFLPTEINWIFAIICAGLAGALWGLVVGAFKAFRNVNEVITSIMMNYIAMNLVNYLVKNLVYDPVRNYSQTPVNAFIPKWFMGVLFPGSNADMGIVIAILLAIATWWLLNKTTFGYELKAVGLNRHAGRYAGINEKKGIILSMVISGALAGIGGGLVYLGDVGTHLAVVKQLLQAGFDGIPVALLAQSNPLGVIFTALFIAHIQMGGNYLQQLSFVPEVISIVIAVIIYLSALSVLFKERINALFSRKGGK